MNVPYHIVVEPAEHENYAEYIDGDKILVLPDDFSKLGRGSIPVRNWVWEHSIRRGVKRHWILDDNIRGFCFYNGRNFYKCKDGYCFRFIEDFADQFENVALAGMHYKTFIMKRVHKPEIRLNTRIYSCILINNALPYRWRGKYNEDTDLSLRVLKDGWCTVITTFFVALKMATMQMKGGNTDTIYKETRNRYEFAESLREQHPDVAKVVKRWGRWHHFVDYRPFKKNKLIPRKGGKIKDVYRFKPKLTERV